MWWPIGVAKNFQRGRFKKILHGKIRGGEG